MQQFVLAGAEEGDFGTIHATHLAAPGSFVCYANYDGSSRKRPVILWGVNSDASPEPITFEGVWDGGERKNMFVLLPDGSCVKYERYWSDEAAAISDLRAYDLTHD